MSDNNIDEKGKKNRNRSILKKRYQAYLRKKRKTLYRKKKNNEELEKE